TPRARAHSPCPAPSHSRTARRTRPAARDPARGIAARAPSPLAAKESGSEPYLFSSAAIRGDDVLFNGSAIGAAPDALRSRHGRHASGGRSPTNASVAWFRDASARCGFAWSLGRSCRLPPVSPSTVCGQFFPYDFANELLSDGRLAEPKASLQSLVYQGLVPLSGFLGLRLEALDHRVIDVDRDARLAGGWNDRTALAFGEVIRLLHSLSVL